MEDLFRPYLTSESMHISTRQPLFRAGDTVRHLYYLKQGTVKLERLTEESGDIRRSGDTILLD